MLSKISRILLSVLILASCALAVGPQATPDHQVTFKVLHSFTGGSDGGCIYGGLARDHAGNLYGVSGCGAGSGDGTLFKLTPGRHGYTFHVLEDFSQSTGRQCMAAPTIDEEGNLFGVCWAGGSADDGTLWEYSCAGKFRVLHSFYGPSDGMDVEGSVALDSSSNVYGTAYTWGDGSGGTLWKYSRRSGEFTVLHAFAYGDTDGELLPAGPTIDKDGVIWGTTEDGPNCYYCGDGTVWKYDPRSRTFTTVLDFSGSGIHAPQSVLAIDTQGNLFGTAFGTAGGRNNCGVVYELRKSKNYTPTVVYQFTAKNGDGCDPWGRVVLDRDGNLLGVTGGGGTSGNGAVYELKPEADGWQERILHSLSFDEGCSSTSGLVTDDHCRWFGTATYCGKSKWGTAFEVSGVP